MKNIHKDETCVIIGNGPSLADVPLEFLNKYPSFACNQIRMLEGFQPTYFSTIGANMLKTVAQREAMRPTIENARMAFVNVQCADYYKYDHIVPILGSGAPGAHQRLEYKLGGEYDLKKRMLFRLQPTAEVYQGKPFVVVGVGFTQTYINLQIAYWMGFQTALMVGIDHNFGDPDRHFYKDDEIEEFHLSEQREEERAYRLEIGADWAYSQARGAYEADGRQILNLTPDSKAKALEFGNIKDWM